MKAVGGEARPLFDSDRLSFRTTIEHIFRTAAEAEQGTDARALATSESEVAMLIAGSVRSFSQVASIDDGVRK